MWFLQSPRGNEDEGTSIFSLSESGKVNVCAWRMVNYGIAVVWYLGSLDWSWTSSVHQHQIYIYNLGNVNRPSIYLSSASHHDHHLLNCITNISQGRIYPQESDIARVDLYHLYHGGEQATRWPTLWYWGSLCKTHQQGQPDKGKWLIILHRSSLPSRPS